MREQYGMDPLKDHLGERIYAAGTLRALDVLASATVPETTSQPAKTDDTTTDQPVEGKKSLPKPQSPAA